MENDIGMSKTINTILQNVWKDFWYQHKNIFYYNWWAAFYVSTGIFYELFLVRSFKAFMSEGLLAITLILSSHNRFSDLSKET